MDTFLNIYGGREYERAYRKGRPLNLHELRIANSSSKTDNFGFDVIDLSGCEKLFNLLNLKESKSFLDQGSGTGQVILYAFLNYPNLSHVYGIELIKSRYDTSKEYLAKLPSEYKIVEANDKFMIEHKGRKLILMLGSMYDFRALHHIDVILSNVCVRPHNMPKYTNMLESFHAVGVKPRIATYVLVNEESTQVCIPTVINRKHKLWIFKKSS